MSTAHHQMHRSSRWAWMMLCGFLFLPTLAWGLTGDLNGDGKVTVSDVQCAVLVVLDLNPEDSSTNPSCLVDQPQADLDCTGDTTVADIQLSVAVVLGDILGVNGMPAIKDSDNDNVHVDCDLCPEVADPDQVDGDGDQYGDACDAFPGDPDESLDSDNDGVGDNADSFPFDPDNDVDGDGLGANEDNCPHVPVGTEQDLDDDGKPDVCDDGNTEDGDGCDADCTPSECPTPPTCEELGYECGQGWPVGDCPDAEMEVAAWYPTPACGDFPLLCILKGYHGCCHGTCGDMICDAGHETHQTCSMDCQEPFSYCGDGTCDPDEDKWSCVSDCCDMFDPDC